MAALLAGVAPSALAAHTQARLILAAEIAKPGDTVLAGIQLRMDPQWHTYWKNSGASGIPTSIQWDLPAGITAGEIQWPVPEKLPPDDLVTYVYHDEVVLLVPLKLADDLQPGPRELKARISWLECKEQCIPGRAELTATFNVGAEAKTSASMELIKSWQKKLPQSATGLAPRAWWETGTNRDTRPLVLEWSLPAAAGEVDFYPLGSDDFEVQGATERVPADAGKIRLRKLVKKFRGDWPKDVLGLIVQGSGDQRVAYEVTVPFTEPVAGGMSPLWIMLAKAFLGGLILNVMPCVLPVIALKILGFVNEARNDRAHLRTLGLVYMVGVLVSFLALAALAITLKAAGYKIGWGMQFNNPYFLITMAVLLTLIALNLFGVFEITLGGRALTAAATLSSKSGLAGAFFNGLLATALATSCTAPVLGAALGFASAQRPLIIVLIMLAVGLGLAAPYVVLSWQPAWLKLLPKPGHWMERFRAVMGFPMLAAAVWICSLTSTYYGDRTWALAMFLVLLSLAAWVYGQFVQRSAKHRGAALLLVAVLLVAGYSYPLEKQLQWRHPIEDAAKIAASSLAPAGGAWEPWSARAVAHAQEEGHPVLVDFTAKWCLTCQLNVKPALESQSVRQKMDQVNAATFVADYTRRPDEMTVELNRHGRAGVPLVLVYPAKAGAAPIVLPEVLTPGIVLEALARATE